MANRIAIVGSRSFPVHHYPELETFLQGLKGWTVLSGGAPGVDEHVERVCARLGIPFEKLPADWDGLGRGAGMERNGRLVESARLVVAFQGPCVAGECRARGSCPHGWRSHGTQDTIARAQKAGKLWAVVERLA